MASMRAAVFLDRDGTLIEDRGYLSQASQVEFLPGAIEALQRLRDDFLIFIVTNQSGVGMGKIGPADVERVNDHVVGRLREAGIAVAEVYVCPHTAEDGCACRKPSPHFLEKARRDFGVELAASFAIGDHPCDVELALNAGARGIYVLTGHGERHRDQLAVRCEVVPALPQAIELVLATHAADVLRAGGLVAFPTETVYGLGADASNESAVRRIFEVKGRPAGHPLIVHLADGSELSKWAVNIPETAHILARRFWPGPLTLILEKSGRVPAAVTGGQETVGLRVPDHPLARAMLERFGGAVAAPSANRFGKVSPTNAQHVRDDLGDRVEYVLDGGACAVGIESTILDLSHGPGRILRPGAVTREALESALGASLGERAPEGAPEVRAPGMLASHYAPRAEVVLVRAEALEAEAEKLIAEGKKVAVIAERAPAIPALSWHMLAASEEALAHELYASLREADRRGADIILVALPREAGLGAALLDRLRKAAAPRDRD